MGDPNMDYERRDAMLKVAFPEPEKSVDTAHDHVDDVLGRLEAIEQAATPVPWVVYNAPRPGIDQAGEYGRNVIYASKFAGEFAGVGRAEDAALIVAQRNTYPEALAVVRAAEKLWEALRTDESLPGGHLTYDMGRALAAFLEAAQEAV